MSEDSDFLVFPKKFEPPHVDSYRKWGFRQAASLFRQLKKELSSTLGVGWGTVVSNTVTKAIVYENTHFVSAHVSTPRRRRPSPGPGHGVHLSGPVEYRHQSRDRHL